jgi:hypothetical protein
MWNVEHGTRCLEDETRYSEDETRSPHEETRLKVVLRKQAVTPRNTSEVKNQMDMIYSDM